MEPYFDADEFYDEMDEPWLDDGYDQDDYDDEDPYGCCCPGECLNPHFSHRMSECFTAEDMIEPSRLREFWWMLKFRCGAILGELVDSFRRREPGEEDDLPF